MGSTIGDPVVETGMEDVTKRLRFSADRTISVDYWERATLIQALLLLHAAGHKLIATELVPWATEHGWSRPAIKELDRVLSMFAQGRAPRGPRNTGQQWRDDILDVWRTEAGWTPPRSRSSRDW